MKHYQCLKQTAFKDEAGYQLVTIRESDIEKIRLWRNEQMDVLRQQNKISSVEQKTYFEQVIWPTLQSRQPVQILFSFLYQDECIGYGGLTNLDWFSRRAEVSFLLDTRRLENASLYAKDYQHFLFLLCQVAFKELGMHRIYTETFSFRDAHIKVLEDFGFKREGVLREHIFKRSQWYDSIMHGLLAGEFADAE